MLKVTADFLLHCKMCRGDLTYDPNTGERVCTSCGVVSEVSGTCPRFYVSNSFEGTDRNNPSSAMSYDIDLPTVIDHKDVDAHGRGLAQSYELHRLRQLNDFTISRDSKRRSLSKAIDVIKRATELLNLSDAVADVAYEIYRKCNGSGETRRKAITGVALASVYVACKQLGIARSTREIEQSMKEISEKSVHRYYNLLLNQENMRYTMQDSATFVPRIAAKAGLSARVERKAIDILSRVRNDPALVSKKPISLAASAVYIAAELCGEPVTQLRIASASEVTPVTIRKRSLQMTRMLESIQAQELGSEPEKSSHEVAVLEEPLVGASDRSSNATMKSGDA